MSQPWKSGLCGCTQDIKLCLVGCCCPCYVYSLNAEQIDNSDKTQSFLLYCCCAGYCSCLFHKGKRQALRAKYSLIEEPSDVVATLPCLSPCAVCQERRELNARDSVRGPTSTQPR